MNLTSLNVICLNCEQEVMAALHSFNSYHHIWKEDREDAMRKYDKLDIRMLLWLWRAEVFFFSLLLQVYPSQPYTVRV